MGKEGLGTWPSLLNERYACRVFKGEIGTCVMNRDTQAAHRSMGHPDARNAHTGEERTVDATSPRDALPNISQRQ